MTTNVGNTVSSETTSVSEEYGVVSQQTPLFKITVDGTNFNEKGYSNLVSRLMVDETMDRISYAEIIMANFDMDMADDDIFSPKKRMEISTGYLETNYEVRDVFETQNPLFKVAGSGVIVMRGFSTGIQATREGRRRVFNGKTHSAIASQIASEYEWVPDIDSTILSYPQIMQAGKTDYEMLREFAVLNGLDFYISNDILHFHGMRENLKPITKLIYTGPNSMILSGDFTIESEGRSVSVSISEFNPLSGDVFNVNSEDSGKSIINETGSKVTTWQDLAAIRSLFLVDTGQFLTQDEAKLYADGLMNAGRYVVRANFKCLGNELIHPYTIITLDGISRFSGNYFVKRVIHTIENNVYMCDVEAVRAFIYNPVEQGVLIGAEGFDIPTAGGRRDVTNKSQSAGTVRS